jgi:hypothetical protein
MAVPTLDALLAEIQGLPPAMQVAEMERFHGRPRQPRQPRRPTAQWTAEGPPAQVHFRLLAKPDRRVLAMLLDAEPMDDSAMGLAREFSVKPALRHLATSVRAYIRPSGLHRISVLLRPGVGPEVLAELEPGRGL